MKQLQLTMVQKMTIAIEYRKEKYLEIENNRTIPGTPRYYCNIELQDHLKEILEILD